MYAIKTQGLSKHYKTKFALEDLNLVIKQGEVYGFIGRNGAGKTTTINLLLSLIHPSGGTFLINGEEVLFRDQDYKKRIGFVPDVPTFPKYLTAKEYVTYTCEMFDVSKDEIKHRVEEVLTFVDLKDDKKTIGSYSRGMKQRLAIAQALVHDPEIIIMDEPTSALDPIGRKEVMNIILKLKGKKTIFYSTHILEDVEKVCDRIGLLEEGKLILEDTITNILAKYYRDQVVIISDKSNEEVVKVLQSNNVKNQLRINNEGVACVLNGDKTANDILKILIDNNVNIIEFKRQKVSLEDVFMRVTNEETT